MKNYVVLVDQEGKEIGSAEKLLVHKKGLLHLAFSIFVFNKNGELLLQKRAISKYHSGGLWSNTCCSHPFPGESILDAAHRRLQEEMGFDCPLEESFTFSYKATLDNDLIENEFDHVLFGKYDGEPLINTVEVCEYKWVKLDWLLENIKKQPYIYTYWLREVLKNFKG